MQAGKLRHRVTIERATLTQDPNSGAMVAAWAPMATVWAEFVPLSAREFIAAQAVQSSVSVRVTIRRLAGVEANMRLRHDGKLYNIAGVLPDPKSGREYLTLPCSELPHAAV